MNFEDEINCKLEVVKAYFCVIYFVSVVSFGEFLLVEKETAETKMFITMQGLFCNKGNYCLFDL